MSGWILCTLRQGFVRLLDWGASLLMPNAQMAGVFARKEEQIDESDIDSLSVLPLGILPMQTAGLRNVRMVKDSKNVGTGLIYPGNLHDQFPTMSPDDHTIVRAVAELHSFDVYSLRIALRAMGVKVDNTEHLCLSGSKQQELQSYIRPFTERLVKQIYGSDSDEAGAVTDVSTLFHDPDVNAAREKLKNIAGSLSISLADVPQFLEDYGDIYLSVAYYRSCLDMVRPVIEDFLASTAEIKNHPQMKQNFEMVKVCTRLETKFLKLQEVLVGRFEVFAKSTDEMWANMSAEKFGDFKKLVEDNHTALGGLLCTLTVKMNLWHNKFPTRHVAGPSRRADFIMTDMRQGV